jgi:hypothetical protein
LASGASETPKPQLLSPEEVGTVFSIVSDYDPIVVGGQCISMWVDYLAQHDEELALMGSVSSADVDYYENPKAAERLAERLKGDLLLPDDALNLSANSCTVTAFLNGKQIHVDFMRNVIGVDPKDIRGRYVAIEGKFPNIDHPVKMTLMHPLDCILSRLANIETLKRIDEWSLYQTKASFLVFRAFIDQLLAYGETQEATSTLSKFEYAMRDRFYRTEVYPYVCADIIPVQILTHYENEDRIDLRWRERTLAGISQRMGTYETKLRNRLGL